MTERIGDNFRQECQKRTLSFDFLTASSPSFLSSAYLPKGNVSIRNHTSAPVSTCQHTSAYVSIRQHTSARVGDIFHVRALGLSASMLTRTFRIAQKLRNVKQCEGGNLIWTRARTQTGEARRPWLVGNDASEKAKTFSSAEASLPRT